MIKVFTNGCFSLIHAGHVDLFEKAKALGDHLTVAINSDESYWQLKNRPPVFNQVHRKKIIESIRFVDKVIIFNEISVEKTIREMKDEIDVLVKGGDYKDYTEVVGWKIVGKERVILIPISFSVCTSGILNEMGIVLN